MHLLSPHAGVSVRPVRSPRLWGRRLGAAVLAGALALVPVSAAARPADEPQPEAPPTETPVTPEPGVPVAPERPPVAGEAPESDPGNKDLLGLAPPTHVVEILTMSALLDAMRQVDLALWLDPATPIPEGYVPTGEIGYLMPLVQYIDLNVLGSGDVVELQPERIVSYIQAQLIAGRRLDALGSMLVAEFRRDTFSRVETRSRPDADRGPAVSIGGYLVTEFEVHEEPDGELVPLLEVNQLRLYFSAALNRTAARNRVVFLAEFNPVPEEVVHQIDSATVRLGGADVTLVPTELEVEGLIPFERLHMTMSNIAGSGLDLTLGQFRNPFGLWSDYTSHRNFSSAKSNVLVNGFALKKVELGVSLSRRYDFGLDWQLAVVHGRRGRTAPLDRADYDKSFDLVGRLGYRVGQVDLGASFYFAGFKTDQWAAGIDARVTLGSSLVVSGELVHQRNGDLRGLYGAAVPEGTEASSWSGYLQADLALSEDLHVYGFYEAWNLLIDGHNANTEAPGGLAIKVFHGVRYNIIPQLRWIVLEYGHMFHEGFDRGQNHVSTQMELTF